MYQACGERISGVLPFRGFATAPGGQESTNNVNMSFIEQDPRKTKVLVSGLKGPSIGPLSSLLMLKGNSTTNESYSSPTPKFPILKGKAGRRD